MNDTTRTLSSLSIILLLLLLSAFTSFGIVTAAAKTDPPQLIKLTNSTTASTLLPDSRFLLGYNTLQGPSLGALAAWSTFSNGTTNAGYASLLGSVPTAENVPGFAPGCIGASTACPFLDEGYIRTFVGSSQQNETMKVLDTLSGTSELIPLHSPATPANKCLTSNLTTVYFCNFLVNNLYASGGGAVGVSPFPHKLSGGGTVYSNEVVTWNGGKWTQLTPNDYQIVQTPCQYQNGVNITFGFDPTVIGDPLYSGSVGPQNFMPGDGGHVAYAVANYSLDTPSGGCGLVQHETSVVMYVDGIPVLHSFPAPTYNATSKIYSCAGRCFGGFIGFTGNLVRYTTWTGTGQSNYTSWVYSKLEGNYQIPGPNLEVYASNSITDGSRLLWITPDTKNSGNNVVWVFDPGRSVVASNGTVLHSVYPLGSFGGAGLVGGAQPFGIDGNTALWYFTNSTGTYLQAYELYDQATSGGRLLPAVSLTGPPFAAGGSLGIYYDNGLAAWVGATGNSTDPLAIYVYNVKAAEAGQPSLSSLRLGAVGLISASSSSFSQGWFFINGGTTSDPVNQVYTLDVTGLLGSSSTSTTSSSTSSSTLQSSRSSSSVTSQTSTVLTTTGGGGDLIPGVPNLDLGIGVLLVLGAIGALLYYFFFTRVRGPGVPPIPPVIPPGGGEVTPSDGAKAQKKKDCSKEKLAFDSALARYNETLASVQAYTEAYRAGLADAERGRLLDLNASDAMHKYRKARNDYAGCLGVSPSELPLPTDSPPSGFQPVPPGDNAPTDEEKKREEVG
ncbi:MAG: hypothetical protein OK436_01360 [Thaumarchaeota archaeon]|nr:hypothetical protein [Nitrososphaerota archaeon]